MLETGASGADAFAKVLPYYMASSEMAPPKIDVSPAVYATVDATIPPDFDYRETVARFGRISVVRGAGDYAKLSAIAAILDAAEEEFTIPQSGHFPFHENPSAFNAALSRVVEALTRSADPAA